MSKSKRTPKPSKPVLVVVDEAHHTAEARLYLAQLVARATRLRKWSEEAWSVVVPMEYIGMDGTPYRNDPES